MERSLPVVGCDAGYLVRRRVQQLAEVFGQRWAVLGIRQREFDERLEVAFKVADVEPPFSRCEPQTHPFASRLEQTADGVSELDLSFLAGPGHVQVLEDRRAEHVP